MPKPAEAAEINEILERKFGELLSYIARHFDEIDRLTVGCNQKIVFAEIFLQANQLKRLVAAHARQAKDRILYGLPEEPGRYLHEDCPYTIEVVRPENLQWDQRKLIELEKQEHFSFVELKVEAVVDGKLYSRAPEHERARALPALTRAPGTPKVTVKKDWSSESLTLTRTSKEGEGA